MDLCKRIHTLILVLSLSHGLRLKSNTISQTQMAADKKHFFDWMAHAHNLSKGADTQHRADRNRCHFCGQPETQQRINVSCTNPPLVKIRVTHKKI